MNFHYYWQTLHRWEPLVYNTLVEHYLQVWSRLSDAATRVQWEQRVVRLLESPEAKYDRHQTLILCQAVNFRPGVLYLYEENKLWDFFYFINLKILSSLWNVCFYNYRLVSLIYFIIPVWTIYYLIKLKFLFWLLWQWLW